MKNWILILLFLLTVALTACGGKTPMKEAEKQPITKEQEALVRKLVEDGGIAQVGAQFELRITEQEAKAKGVTAESYREIQKMVDEMNRLMREQVEQAKNDPETKSMDLNGQQIFDKQSE